jgi:hypothetical protein
MHAEAQQHEGACSRINTSHARQEAGKINKLRSLERYVPQEKSPTDFLPIMPSYCECIKGPIG